MKQKLLDLAITFLQGIISLAGNKNAPAIAAHLAERLTPIVTQQTPSGRIQFYCPGKLPEWRARTLLTKEPDTIEWINTFQDGEVLWDIGANIGVYTLYAAKRGIKVLAFEPGPANYYVLNRNIELNKFDDHVSALCIAFDENTVLDALYMSRTDYGGALSSFAEAVDWEGKTYRATFRQAAVGFRVDDFIAQFQPLFPTHIKLDVDGNEGKVIAGAQKILSDNRLHSVLIELNEERPGDQAVRSMFEENGFTLEQKSRVTEREESKFYHVSNHIFRRQ